MERNERVWITAWSAFLGFSLLILHNWIETLSKPGAYFGVIWPLYVVTITLPLTLQMLSRYRNEKLLWILVTVFSIVMGGTASYVGHQAWIEDLPSHFSSASGEPFLMVIIVFICWFILMPFVEHKLLRQSWCDDYTLLFSTTWSNAAKLLSAAILVGLFWGLLFLWAGLFTVVKVNFFRELFTDRSFVYPVTTIAFGIGLSLYSNKKDALIGHYRTSLNVLGWLLPLVAFIMLLFLIALLFQGLEPLWKTGYATVLMLILVGSMIFLFNAAWQDACGTYKFPKWLLNLISLGLVAMPLYIVLCAYSLGLRISQYGWSIERVWAALAVFVLAIYALGYAGTSLRREAVWMLGAKSVNIAGALILVVLLTLTSTPVLDPARISINSQIDRLFANRIAVNDFDFDYLRFDGGKYGNDELRELLNNNNHPQAELIHEKVKSILLKEHRSYSRQTESSGLNHEKLMDKLKLYSKGTMLDPAFVDFLAEQLNGQKFSLNCDNNNQLCQILSIDLNANGQDELVLFNNYQIMVFGLENGRWRQIGNLNGDNIAKLVDGASLTQSLEKKDVEVLLPKWSDIRIGNDRYSVSGIQ